MGASCADSACTVPAAAARSVPPCARTGTNARPTCCAATPPRPRRTADGRPASRTTPSQYTSFRFTTHLVEAGIGASIGTVGDALDNALMESAIGLYKTELIKPRGPWKNLTGVELATAEYVDWYNSTRLHGEIGHVPPGEYEALHYRQKHIELQATATT